MPKFDAAIGLDETTLNGWMAALFARQDVRSKVFANSRTVPFEGADITVRWDLQAAPTVSLQAPTSDQWKTAVKDSGDILAPAANAFVVHFPAIDLSRTKADGTRQGGTVALAVVVVVVAAGTGMRLDPEAVIVDLGGAKPIDRVVYKQVLIPQILRLARSALPMVQLPTPPLPAGMALGQVSVAVGDGRLAGLANLESRGAPDSAGFADLPRVPLVALVDGGVVQAIVEDTIRGAVGKTESQDGSADFKLGKAKYSASVTAKSLAVRVDYGTDVRIALGASLAIAASAGLDVLSACPLTAALGKL